MLRRTGERVVESLATKPGGGGGSEISLPLWPESNDAPPGDLSARQIRPTLNTVPLTRRPSAIFVILSVELNLALHLGATLPGFPPSGWSARRTRWGSGITVILRVELNFVLQLGAVMFAE
jgi:hypothetical protein